MTRGKPNDTHRITNQTMQAGTRAKLYDIQRRVCRVCRVCRACDCVCVCVCVFVCVCGCVCECVCACVCVCVCVCMCVCMCVGIVCVRLYVCVCALVGVCVELRPTPQIDQKSTKHLPKMVQKGRPDGLPRPSGHRTPASTKCRGTQKKPSNKDPRTTFRGACVVYVVCLACVCVCVCVCVCPWLCV